MIDDQDAEQRRHGWRKGVEDAIAEVHARRRILATFNTEMAKVKPEYLAAFDEVLVSLEALLERGHARSSTPIS